MIRSSLNKKKTHFIWIVEFFLFKLNEDVGLFFEKIIFKNNFLIQLFLLGIRVLNVRQIGKQEIILFECIAETIDHLEESCWKNHYLVGRSWAYILFLFCFYFNILTVR